MRIIRSKGPGAAGAFIVGISLLAGPALAKAANSHVFDMSMKPILEQYLNMQETLAGDSAKGVQEAGRKIVMHASKLDAKSVTGEHAEHYKSLPLKLTKTGLALSKAATLEDARQAFKQLSKPMAMWGTMSKPTGVDVLFCSMAKAGWLQKHGEVKNPYYGASMLGCGAVVGGAQHSAASMAGEHAHH